MVLVLTEWKECQIIKIATPENPQVRRKKRQLEFKLEQLWGGRPMQIPIIIVSLEMFNKFYT